MPRPTKIAKRYKSAFERLSACDPTERETWLNLLVELQGLCEAVDQTAERLYRLERVMLTWSGESRPDGLRGGTFGRLPGDGSAFGRIVHDAIHDDDD